MGSITSKSPLERRNTLARRSQRRTIHSLKSKVDKISLEINSFRGTDEDDEKFKELTNRIYRIHKELTSKSRDLQPQLRNFHQTTITKLEEASRALEDKIIENREKALRKQAELQEKQKQKQEKSKKNIVELERQDDESDIEITEVQENVEDEDQEVYEEHEESQLASTEEKRKTVELKFIKVIPESTVEADVHSELPSPKMKTAEEKRKSILKMGVPVMPGMMMREMNKKLSIVSPEDDPQTTNGSSNNHLDTINDINEELAAIEYQIADFVGKKNGTQYNRMRDKLNSYYNEVGRMITQDENTLKQITLCKNYVKSCLNFLDERAVEDNNTIEDKKENKADVKKKVVDDKNKSHDNVFFAENNNVLSQHEVNLKLQQLTKTTSI